MLWPICMMGELRHSVGAMISKEKPSTIRSASGPSRLQSRWCRASSCRRSKRQVMTWPSPCLSPEAPRNGARSVSGFSLKRAYGLIHQTRRDLLLLSLGAIVCGTSLAIFLAMRISRPIGHLVTAAQAIGERIL